MVNCTKQIMMRIAIAKEAFNRKISLKLTLVRCYVWRIALYSSETWALRKLEHKYFDSFEMLCWRRMEKIKWSK